MTTTHDTVREFYGNAARTGTSCCSPACCDGSDATEAALRVGYTVEQLAAIPEQASLGLGCGNPTSIAELAAGETVLDLGAGAGVDCFLAANAVGPTGRVIGVDMTPDMVSRAREAAADEWPNVEFRLGEIEHLPVADGVVDVVISNCVVNLSPDKAAVFREAFRVLKPGGRIRISDVLALGELPEALRNDLAALAACVGGAATVAETESMLRDAGFTDIEVEPKVESAAVIAGWLPGAEHHVTSATIRATRPEG